MIKNLAVALLFLTPFFTLNAPGFAETEAPEPPPEEEFSAPAATDGRARGALNMNSRTMRFNELASRVTELERDMRFQSDRIRQLERTVEDWRRSR